MLAVSPALAEALAKITGDGLPAIVPNVVDTGFFRPPPRPPVDPVEVLCVAMLNKNKGIDVLLEAVSLLRRQGCAVRLRVIGEGPERAFLEVRSAQLGLERDIVFAGAATRTEVREAMWNARVFVLPSRVETFGLVLAEAMACGLPVVATRSGGPESFLRPPFGRLVATGDALALASGIAEALDLEPGAVTSAARAHAVSQFGPDAFRAHLARVYGKVRPH
jgi:glycosyltransferase involved in cell wall biosynthesis